MTYNNVYGEVYLKIVSQSRLRELSSKKDGFEKIPKPSMMCKLFVEQYFQGVKSAFYCTSNSRNTYAF